MKVAGSSGPSLRVRSCKHAKQISSLEFITGEDTFRRGVCFCSFAMASLGRFAWASVSSAALMFLLAIWVNPRRVLIQDLIS